MSSKLCYFVLGAAGSGRREILADLAASVADEGPVTVLLSESEAPDIADEALAKCARVARWRFSEPADAANPVQRLETDEIDEDATTLFIVIDGRGNPVDFIESAAAWLPGSGWELGRVLFVMHCALGERTPKLKAWFEACVHFADYVLLNRRDGVSNKWLSDFQRHFKDLCFPCHFEFVKGGKVRNPAFVLLPEPRRFTPAFVLEQPDNSLEAYDDIEVMIETEDGQELSIKDERASRPKDSVGADDGEDPDPTEPYFERMPNGRRLRELPAVGQFLEGEN